MGFFSVASEPAGAAVFLDSKRIGTTPITKKEFAPGEYIVRFELKGYVPLSIMGEVKAGESVNIGSFTLQPKE